MKKNKENTKRKLYLALQCLSILVFIGFLVLKENGVVPYFLFWPLLWICIGTTLAQVKCSAQQKIAALIILEIGISLITLIALPGSYHIERDDVFEAQFANTIVEDGIWNPFKGVGFAENYYGHNPILHYISAIISVIGGISTYTLTSYLLLMLLRITFVLAAYLCISSIVEKKYEGFSFIATLIFMASPRLFAMGISRRFMASIFFLYAIYTCIEFLKTKKPIWRVLFIFFSGMVVLSDHSTTYLLMGVFGLGIVYNFLQRIEFPYVAKRRLRSSFVFEAMSIIGMWFIWNTLVTRVLFIEELTYIKEVITFFITTNISLLHIGGGGSPVNINHMYENMIIYVSQLGMLLLGGIGWLYHVKNQKKETPFEKEAFPFFLFIGIVSIGMYGFFGLLMRTEWIVIAQVYFWFASLGVSIAGAAGLFFLTRKAKNRIKVFWICITLLLFFTGGILFGIAPTLTNRPLGEDIVFEFPESKTKELYVSGAWLKGFDAEAQVIGDTNVFDIYTGVFEIDVLAEGYIRDFYLLEFEEDILYFMNAEFIHGYYTHTQKKYTPQYVIINEGIFKYPSFVLGNPHDESFKQILNNAYLDKVYDNGEIQVYRKIES